MWQKERERVENEKFLLVEKIQILRQLTLLHQQKKKKKAKRRWHHQLTSSSSSTASDSSTDKESHNDRLKTNTENEKSKWKLPKKYGQLRKQIFWRVRFREQFKRNYYVKTPSQITLINVKNLDDILRDTLREKCKTN